MNSIDLIRMGLKNLFRRKVRTFLTVLGVVIGTASIVVMVSLGYGMNENFKKELEKMGSLQVINVSPSYGGMGGSAKPKVLDDKAVEKIAKLNKVIAVTPLLETSVKMVSGRYGAYIQLIGINPDTMDDFDFKIQEGGRALIEGDELSIVMGSMVPMNFYDLKARNNYYYGPGAGDGKPKVDVLVDKLTMSLDMSYGDKKQPGTPAIPKQKQAKVYKIKVVGLIKEGSMEYDYSTYININTLKKLMAEYKKTQSSQPGQAINNQQEGYNRVLVKVGDMNDVKDVQKAIKDMGYEAYSLTEYLDSMKKTASTMQMVLGGIGAISLLVAAIGITNTMVMSIYERTREIGVMKVIGAALSDIKKLFLFESGMIGLSGGIIGLGLSKLLSLILNTFAGGLFSFLGPATPGSEISIIPLWLAGFVLVFATMVGLISGYSPARRAMKLSALEAIKTE